MRPKDIAFPAGKPTTINQLALVIGGHIGGWRLLK
jgi:hypothetical protein